ncbi:MAG: LuxR family transcriptional regulator [Humibacillus sp.]|nr:LuxR family transcriptional regulator [Humibacillus sp.]MDN5778898.1 LuxR family transcriptional regulator [Humibacillus sp.]
MFIGRGTERRTIERLLAGARLGDSGVLVIVGEPGIGKTSLLELARTGAAGARTVSARGVEEEREVAFSGLHQLFAPLLGEIEDLPAPQAEALAVALSLRSGATPERFAVGAAVLGLLSRAADEQALVVVVDDAHLLDPSSAQAIAFAARRLVTDRVAVIAALRSGEQSPLLALPILRLGPLSVEDTRALLVIDNKAPWEDDQLTRFHEATGGNPLAILELAGEAERLAAAPPSVPMPLTGKLLAAYSTRVRTLSTPARGVLLLAATDCHDLRALEVACTASGLTLAHIAEAETAGLVRLTGQAIEFHHPLVRAAVYGAAEPAGRREAHRLLGAAVGELDRRAWHLAEAALGPDDAAAALLEAAAEDSARRGANAVAAAQFERSAVLKVERGGIGRTLARAGEQAWLAGASIRAVADLERALDLADTPVERAAVRGRLGAIAGRCGSLEQARDMLFTAADEAAPHDPDAAVLLLADAIDSCFYLCDTQSALRAARRITELNGPGVSATAARWGSLAAGVALILGETGDRGADLIRSAITQPLDASEEADQWRFRWPLVGPLFLRETGFARAVMATAVRTVRNRAAVGMLPFLLTLVARDDAGTASWADAEVGYTEAIQIARETGQLNDLALALAGLACLEARTGASDPSRAHASEARELAARNSAHLARLWTLHAAGDLAAASGDAAKAAEAYSSLAAALADLGVKDPDLWPGAELVECHCRLGDEVRAAQVARDFMTAARAKGQPWALARARRATALTAQPAAAEEEFEGALTLHDQTPDLYEAARTRLAYGAWLRRSRRRVDARPLLHAALETFELLGAQPWAESAAAELEATGQTVMRRGSSVLGGLTPQERQIAVLLAAGQTTREAAVGLFLSPKTVEYHLRHVYLKLGIHSRDDLTKAIDAGIDGPRQRGHLSR